MSTTFDELEKQARLLSAREKAALALMLIEELDATSDVDAEQLWVEEAQRRYDAFLAGELPAHEFTALRRLDRVFRNLIPLGHL
jgi:hypothetical protein